MTRSIIFSRVNEAEAAARAIVPPRPKLDPRRMKKHRAFIENLSPEGKAILCRELQQRAREIMAEGGL